MAKQKRATGSAKSRPDLRAKPATVKAAQPENVEESPRIAAEELAKLQREISIAEFFTKNRHLLGFDNPRKALLTTIKEGVDNSLDACEEARILPEVKVAVAQTNGADRFKVTIEDNGPGIVKAQIPRIFAKLLYGSKFHRLKMSRGQQGIGISAAGLYGQLTTGKPICITSKIAPNKPAHYYQLQIDTQHNEPHIIKDEEVKWDHKQGTKVEIELEAKYQKGKGSIDDYLEQTAIANPHTTLIYVTPEGEERKFQRAIPQLPVEPKEIKPHPYGIELGMLIKMLQSTSASTLQGFLCRDFSRVSPRIAKEICDRAKVYDRARPSRIARQEADNLLQSIRSTKIMNPPTNCLSPIGEEQLIKGLKKQIEAEFYAATSRAPSVYRGNPFQVEAAIAYGGGLSEEGFVRLLRFANRVPLLYQQSACAMTRSVATTDWRNYGLQQSEGSLPTGPVTIMVHVASVWVPFTSESKEAIAHYPEIIKETRLALQECGRQLGNYLRRKRRAAEEERKKNYIALYIPHIAAALREILEFSEREEQKVATNLRFILDRSRA
ncbi:MAG: DNA topoisomerase VI subunit B [Planctomycetes bacterium]|nr:DNA topoisomerase VI subunit B [Planctomycetota bacterium]